MSESEAQALGAQCTELGLKLQHALEIQAEALSTARLRNLIRVFLPAWRKVATHRVKQVAQDEANKVAEQIKKKSAKDALAIKKAAQEQAAANLTAATTNAQLEQSPGREPTAPARELSETTDRSDDGTEGATISTEERSADIHAALLTALRWRDAGKSHREVIENPVAAIEIIFQQVFTVAEAEQMEQDALAPLEHSQGAQRARAWAKGVQHAQAEMQGACDKLEEECSTNCNTYETSGALYAFLVGMHKLLRLLILDAKGDGKRARAHRQKAQELAGQACRALVSLASTLLAKGEELGLGSTSKP